MHDISLTGTNFIEGRPSALGQERIYALRPEDGSSLEPAFIVATAGEVERAVTAACAAAAAYAALDPERRAEFLEEIAAGIEGLGDALVDRACAETALPPGRITGEKVRTCGQLRMFASLVREGSWVDARIETADASRPSGPKPDVRRMLAPLGPVSVFGASNFPLAFSVAGGDTASALAAGCPVIVKAHPAHPGTSEMVARVVIAAAQLTKMPPGVFGFLNGGKEVGQHLVMQPGLEAVAFTGAQVAGRALFDLAAARPRPIPVFAEMGSVNPLFVLPGALVENLDTIAKGYAASLCLGVGQFCTNPGVLVGVQCGLFQQFLAAVAGHLAEVAPGTMLYKGVLTQLESAVQGWRKDARLTEVWCGNQTPGRALPALFSTTAEHFMKDLDLHSEVFGPAALAVGCESADQLLEVGSSFEGQLTASVFFGPPDAPTAQRLLPLLSRFAGRVIANGFPTGVEVCSAMQHGGPYPATTDSRSTSVGTAAILRFARPIAFQGLPDEMLPPELQEANPRGIRRKVNGVDSSA